MIDNSPVKNWGGLFMKYIEKEASSTMKNPGLAAVLSAVLPGLGQIYNGRILWAIVWFIITPGLWIGTGGLLGWICHVISAYQAYRQAQRYQQY
jgi:TM2 domain-containing membrane protein YozV